MPEAKLQSQSFSNGMIFGAGGCAIMAMGLLLGLLGGCIAGEAAFQWFHEETLAEIQKHDPLANLNWIFGGGVLGGVAGVVVFGALWVALCRWSLWMTGKRS